MEKPQRPHSRSRRPFCPLPHQRPYFPGRHQTVYRHASTRRTGSDSHDRGERFQGTPPANKAPSRWRDTGNRIIKVAKCTPVTANCQMIIEIKTEKFSASSTFLVGIHGFAALDRSDRF